MIHKGRCLPILLLALFPLLSEAERRSVAVLESSTSGKLVRLNLGAQQGINLGEPVLFSVAEKKIAAGRVIRVDNNRSVVAVLEKFGAESPGPDLDYELLYGEPFAEAENLPPYVADKEEEQDNPGNEKFWANVGEDSNPELDDESYSPEVNLRPKLPLPRTYNPHNLTVGLNLFRNQTLQGESDDPDTFAAENAKTTYSGYSLRYAYTFRTHYWLKAQTPALLSAEFGIGMYNFTHTFPLSVRPDPNTDVAEIRVIPLHIELRYLIEVSRLFRVYPYVGYQYNIVSAVNGSLTGLEPMMGGRLLGGAGAVLVMSENIDTRVEAGTDGVLGGLVVKF
jgi:hypothetical protein